MTFPADIEAGARAMCETRSMYLPQFTGSAEDNTPIWVVRRKRGHGKPTALFEGSMPECQKWIDRQAFAAGLAAYNAHLTTEKTG